MFINDDCLHRQYNCLFPCYYSRVNRKGHRKAQEVHINDETVRALFLYINDERRASVIDPEALFISRKGQRLTVRSVERLVKKYAIASGAGER